MKLFSTTLLHAVTMALLIIMVIGAVALLFARQHGFLILSVQTASMQPTIHPGDVLVVSRQPNDVMVGDIVSYHSLQNERVIISHRLIVYDRSRGLLTTKGDALTDSDPIFPVNRLVGTAQYVIPLLGYGLNFVRRPYGLVTVIYIPAIVLAVAEIKRLQAYYKRQRYVLYT